MSVVSLVRRVAVAAVAGLVLSLGFVGAAGPAAAVQCPNVWYPWETPSNDSVACATKVAVDQVGDPYVWGGNGPDAFDCSGLVYYSYNQAGIYFNDMTAQQMYDDLGRRVGKWEIKPGDLVFYGANDRSITHVAIYLGVNRDNGKREMVEALNYSTGVVISEYREPLNEVVRVVG